MSKYRVEKDVLDRILNLKKRIDRLERNRRLSNAALDAGSLRMPIGGRFVITADDGTRRFLIFSNANFVPNLVRIVMDPETIDGAAASQIFTMYSADVLFEEGNETFIQMYVDADGSASGDKGALSLFQQGLFTWNLNGSVSTEIHLRDLTRYGTDGNIYMVGRWPNQDQLSNLDALYTGARSISSGVSSVVVTYPITFATTIIPVIGLFNVGAVAINWCLTAQSTASFTVAWTGTDAKIINMWNVRL